MVPDCPPTPCREWQGRRNHKGYGVRTVGLKDYLVHRWVYSRLHGGFRAIHGKQIMHLCDNPPCFRYDHLWCGTNQDNVDDRTRKGRSASFLGERSVHAKLTQAEVNEIREALAQGELQRVLAVRYGVCAATINHINTGRRW